MSMQALMSGAECATTSNPLSQVLKHAEGDRSLQHDRVSAGSSSSLYHLEPSSSHASASDIASARQFFEHQTQQSMSPSPSFDVERLRMLSKPQSPAHVDMATAWQGAGRPVFSQAPQLVDAPQSSWANEFELHRGASRAQDVGPGFVAHRFMSPLPYQHLSQAWTPPIGSSKGKGRMTDADFEAAFVEAAALTVKSSAHIEEVDQLEESLRASSLSEGADQTSELQRSWEDALRNSGLGKPSAEELAKWESQFNQLNTEGRLEEETDLERQLQDAFEESFDQYDVHVPEIRMDESGTPQLGPYEFERNNKYMTEKPLTLSHLEHAKDLLANDGSLTEVALLLEAAIQNGDTGKGGYEAWVLLGETRSMDEREDAAMRALAEGTRLADLAGEPAQGLMALAVSYTNESYERASHNVLLRWLRARYPDIEIPLEVPGPWGSRERAKEAFLNAARLQHAQGAAVDPELQAALGVLFYAESAYDRAQDCFETALSANPNDFLLWNRLGSCLSNGSKPEEALGAYRQALHLRPTYTRAIYNVGVACLNIGAYEEAAKHFLSALKMQETNGGGGEKSQQLWQTLQRCFTYMNRNDLAEMARTGASVDSFRLQGFDF